MKVGAFGGVAFVVSDTQIKTLRDMTISYKASISTHAVHLGGGLAEFTGSEPQSISFKLRLSAYLGASPDAELKKLEQYLLNGTPQTFALGNKVFGRYKWLLESMKVTAEYYDKYGNITQCDIAVSLTEYLKG